MKRILGLVLFSFFAATACTPECLDTETDAVYLKFEAPSRESGFFEHPWPSNARRRPDGTLAIKAWPNPTGSSTLDEYLTVIGDHTYGYGLNSASYFVASSPLNESSFDGEPLTAMSTEAPFYLVDIDPESPEYGRLRPLSTKYFPKATTFLPENSLAVLPPFGLSLRSNTTYAMVATDALLSAEDTPLKKSLNFNNAIKTNCLDKAPPSLVEMLAPLRTYFSAQETDISRVIAATVFTTQDVLGEIRRLGQSTYAQPNLEIRSLRIEEEREDVLMATATVQMPSFQAGNVPYQSFGDGGGINWQPDGSAAVHHYETTRVSFILPIQGEMPDAGWPVVLMSHGTGADYASAYRRPIATALARHGIAVVSYDPTLHGPRDPTGSDERLTFFNLFNVLAARDNVRQGGVDLMMLSKLLQSGFTLPSRVTRRSYDARFDADRMGFLGHSQGGLAGSPFLAVEPNIKVAVFSGTSGILNITLQERKEPVDFEQLLRGLLALPEEEVIDDFHPVLNLIQTFIDPADPIAYGSTYLSDPPSSVARDYLFIEGFKDSASPARGHEALAAAAGAPLVAPYFRVPYAAELVGPSPIAAPASANQMTANGAVTIGLIQYPEQDHWPIFDDSDANDRYVEFIRSSLFDGRAQIIPTSY